MFQGLGLLVWILSAVSLACGCPSRCFCHVERKVECSSKGGTIDWKSIPCDTTKLYVNDQMLREISADQFSCIRKLVFLDLRNNLISRIEEGALNGLTLLTTLLLSGNQLSSLPSLGSLTNLKIIEAKINLFTEMPLVFPLTNRYVQINFGFNALRDPVVMPFSAHNLLLPGCSISTLLPTFFPHGKRVRNLDLSFNKLTTLKHLSHLSNVLTLDLSHNDLTVIESLDNFKRVLYIGLQVNRIRTIESDAFVELQQLDDLDMSKNRIRNISAIRDMPSLTEIVLSHNFIVTISGNALCNLPKLRILDLRWNRLTLIPEIHLPNLQSFLINYNFVHSNLSLNHNPFNATLLNLEGNHITNINAKECSRIETIFASHNLIRSAQFPDSGLTFRVLTHLDLSYNFLQTLESFQNFPKLRYLYLKRNFITVWNERGLENMTSLSRLLLQSNQFRELEKLPNLPSLEYLDLSYNHIFWISGDALHCPNLRQLNLSNNNLLVAPSFSRLPVLRILDMSYNQVEFVDSGILGKTFDALESFWLDGNRLRKMPQFPQNKIRFFSLRFNKITAINSTELMYYLLLTHLLLDGNDINERLPVFPSTLLHLSITDNDLMLKNSVWYSPYHIRYLRLKNNEIPFIGHNWIWGQSLSFLDLSFDNIRIISPRAFSSSKSLLTLKLGHNMLSSVDTNTFVGLDRLQFLKLEWNRLLYLTNEIFRNCPRLHNLDLSGNPLVHVSDQAFFGLSNLMYLRMHHMNVTSISLSSSSGKIGYLFLNNNSAVASWAENSSLVIEMPLYHLELMNNKLSSVFPRFKSKTLISLNLRDNCFHSVPKQLQRDTDYPFLDRLILSKNRIKVISTSDFSHLEKLSVLFLDNNEIASIGSGAFRHSTWWNQLILENNHLTFLDRKALPSVSAYFSFNADGNPWHCDCHLLPLQTWLPHLSQPGSCYTPVDKRNISVFDATMKDGECEIQTRDLPGSSGESRSIALKHQNTALSLAMLMSLVFPQF